MASHLISEPASKRVRLEGYITSQQASASFEIADSADTQLAYLENNLPEELFDTATGRAWVNQWNQETTGSTRGLVKSASGPCLLREDSVAVAGLSVADQVGTSSTSQQFAAATATAVQTHPAPVQCNVGIQTDPPFNPSASCPSSPVASRVPTSSATIPPELKVFAQQQMLLVLLHSLRCERQKSHDTSEQIPTAIVCTRPICRKMTGVLTHLKSCRIARSCPEHFCSFTRSILVHFRSCKLISCSLCIPVKNLCINNPTASLEWLLFQLRANAGLLLSDLRNLAAAAKPRPVPKPSAQAPLIPTCSICMDRLISTIVFPCRHFFCEQCAPMIFKCGLCRQTIRSKHRVFF